MCVTSGSQDLKDTIVDRKEGNIKGTTTEIVDDDLRLAALLVKTVRDRSSCGLIDDTEDSETGNGSGILSGLALSVIEVLRGGKVRGRRKAEINHIQAGTVTTA